MSAARSGRSIDVALLTCVTLVVVWCYWIYVPTRFFPWDDGSMAQMAERVTAGELPHRDFRDTYSGALNYWHALGLAVLGRDFLSLRLQLVASFAFALLLLADLARGTLGPRLTMLVAAAVALYGPMQYAGPLPSWYNEWLAIAACWCVLRFARSGHGAWLVGAGAACGVSIAVKIIGAYALCAAGAAILWLEQQEITATPGRPIVFLCCKALGFAALAGIVLHLLARAGMGVEILSLGLPTCLLGTLTVGDDWRRARGGSARRFRRCAARLAPLALGAALPLLALSAPYWSREGLETLWNGLVVLPHSRLDFRTTKGAMPGVETMTVAIVFTALIALATAGARARIACTVVLAGLLSIGVALGTRNFWYLQPWGFMRGAAVLAGLLLVLGHVLRRREETAGDPIPVCVCWFAALTALVQFPFPHGVYALYAAPLGLLAYALAAVSLPGARPLLPALLFAATAASAVLLSARSDVRTLGVGYRPAPVAVPLGAPGASLLVPAPVAQTYRDLVAALPGVAGRCVYAGPDAPEIPYLVHAHYCHPAFYDIFEPGYADAGAFERSLLAWLRRTAPAAVVVNLRPAFSRPYSPAFRHEVGALYARWVLVDNQFLVGTESIRPAAAEP